MLRRMIQSKGMLALHLGEGSMYSSHIHCSALLLEPMLLSHAEAFDEVVRLVPELLRSLPTRHNRFK